MPNMHKIKVLKVAWSNHKATCYKFPYSLIFVWVLLSPSWT